MFPQALDGVIGDRRGGVVAGPGIDWRQWFIVLGMPPRGEVPIVVVEAVGMVEPILKRLAVYVPFARVIGAVAERFQHFGQKSGPRRPDALAAALDAGDGIAPHLLGVVSGQQRRSRRPAAGRVIELREAETVFRQPIKVWRRDFAAIASRIREAHVVGEDNENVGSPGRRISSSSRGWQNRHGEQNEEEPSHGLLRAGGIVGGGLLRAVFLLGHESWHKFLQPVSA